MNKIGTEAGKLFLFLIAKQPRDWNRTTNGILSLTKRFAKDVVNLACKRALAFNVIQYQTIKNICQNGAYNLPLEHDMEEL